MEVHLFLQKLKYGLRGGIFITAPFDGRDFALQGNCNYTLVQTTCAGLNTSIPPKSNIVRAYLNSATVSTIHLVQMEFRVLTPPWLKIT